MIKIKNLTIEFENLKLFENVSFEIPKNKVTMIVGQNGTGKTTLLKTISKTISPKGLELENNSKGMFYLPQKINYTKGLTLYEYLSSIFFKENWKWYLSKGDKQIIEDNLEKLELLDKKNVLIENLSSGELQKANIALGLISNADLLLFDEPTSNMDLINQIKILDIIKKLTQKDITSVIIMHDINLSSSYGDYFIGVNPQHKLMCANKDNFFTEKNLKDIYNIDFKVVNNEKDFYIQIFN